jgi:DNA uptake protein ComE-like DNA-binding protein
METMEMTLKRFFLLAAGAAAFTAILSTGVQGQVGKSLGVVDANVASEADLLKMPHMTPAIVKGLIAKRNFKSITELNAYLLGAGLTQAQAADLYGRAFIHVNLNTATPEEFLLVPGSNKRWAHEFEEYRPWVSWAQFDKEIGKYTTPRNDQATLDKFKQFLFIPIDLNTATDADFMTIPGMTSRMVHEFKEYRPWKAKAQFDKEITKYVPAKETERLWRFVVIK